MKFTDQEILTDVLSSQKFAADAYNLSSEESVTPQVRQAFLSLLSEEHAIQNSAFQQMSQRGWYPTPAADQKKIQEARQKYQNLAQQ